MDSTVIKYNIDQLLFSSLELLQEINSTKIKYADFADDYIKARRVNAYTIFVGLKRELEKATGILTVTEELIDKIIQEKEHFNSKEPIEIENYSKCLNILNILNASAEELIGSNTFKKITLTNLSTHPDVKNLLNTKTTSSSISRVILHKYLKSLEEDIRKTLGMKKDNWEIIRKINYFKKLEKQ